VNGGGVVGGGVVGGGVVGGGVVGGGVVGLATVVVLESGTVTVDVVEPTPDWPSTVVVAPPVESLAVGARDAETVPPAKVVTTGAAKPTAPSRIRNSRRESLSDVWSGVVMVDLPFACRGCRATLDQRLELVDGLDCRPPGHREGWRVPEHRR